MKKDMIGGQYEGTQEKVELQSDEWIWFKCIEHVKFSIKIKIKLLEQKHFKGTIFK